MTATTHTEIYRRFLGELKPARLRFWPLHRARLASAQKSKLALLLLYAPPTISGIVFSFLVYAKFTVESGLGSPAGLNPAAAMALSMSDQLIQVHGQVINFVRVSRAFALLAIAWYGAGLICDDRRAGAHLLYFARPLTKRDYYLAQLATAGTFGLRAVLWPGLLICVVAVFSSPEYSFLREKWHVIVATVGFALFYVLVLSSLVLAISSLSARKMYALAAIFALVFGSGAVAEVMAEMRHDSDWRMLSLWGNFDRVLYWMLDAKSGGGLQFGPRSDWEPWYSVAILGGLALLSTALVSWRLRRLEVA